MRLILVVVLMAGCALAQKSKWDELKEYADTLPLTTEQRQRVMRAAGEAMFEAQTQVSAMMLQEYNRMHPQDAGSKPSTGGFFGSDRKVTKAELAWMEEADAFLAEIAQKKSALQHVPEARQAEIASGPDPMEVLSYFRSQRQQAEFAQQMRMLQQQWNGFNQQQQYYWQQPQLWQPQQPQPVIIQQWPAAPYKHQWPKLSDYFPRR